MAVRDHAGNEEQGFLRMLLYFFGGEGVLDRSVHEQRGYLQILWNSGPGAA